MTFFGAASRRRMAGVWEPGAAETAVRRSQRDVDGRKSHRPVRANRGATAVWEIRPDTSKLMDDGHRCLLARPGESPGVAVCGPVSKGTSGRPSVVARHRHNSGCVYPKLSLAIHPQTKQQTREAAQLTVSAVCRLSVKTSGLGVGGVDLSALLPTRARLGAGPARPWRRRRRRQRGGCRATTGRALQP